MVSDYGKGLKGRRVLVWMIFRREENLGARAAPAAAQGLSFGPVAGDSAKGLTIVCEPLERTFGVGQRIWIDCTIANPTAELQADRLEFHSGQATSC